jgi:hypothetical protein
VVQLPNGGSSGSNSVSAHQPLTIQRAHPSVINLGSRHFIIIFFIFCPQVTYFDVTVYCVKNMDSKEIIFINLTYLKKE